MLGLLEGGHLPAQLPRRGFTRCRRQAPTGRRANPTLIGWLGWRSGRYHPVLGTTASPRGQQPRSVVASTEQDKRLRAELAQ